MMVDGACLGVWLVDVMQVVQYLHIHHLSP